MLKGMSVEVKVCNQRWIVSFDWQN